MGNSPLKDAKFLTNLQPAATDPKRLIEMTPEERQESREALATAVDTGLTLMPIGGLFYKGTKTGVAAAAGVIRQGFKLPFMRNALRNLVVGGAKEIGKQLPKKAIQKATIGNYSNIASAPTQEEKNKTNPPSDYYLP
jgi:hypothetical protein|tara:strand:- start:196 stop:609 length:414 start_codon:yes stop_codon:yes gene_type:complete